MYMLNISLFIDESDEFNPRLNILMILTYFETTGRF